MSTRTYPVNVIVRDEGNAENRIQGAKVLVKKGKNLVAQGSTDSSGRLRLHKPKIPDGDYEAMAEAFGQQKSKSFTFKPNSDDAFIDIPVGFRVEVSDFPVSEGRAAIDVQPPLVDAEEGGGAGGSGPFHEVIQGRSLMVALSWNQNLPKSAGYRTTLTATDGEVTSDDSTGETGRQHIRNYLFQAPDAPGFVTLEARITGSASITARRKVGVGGNKQPISGSISASLQRTASAATDDVAVWQGILNSTDALAFNRYLRFMDYLYCGERDLSGISEFERKRFPEKAKAARELAKRRFLPFTDSDAYRLVKVATEAFVMVNCGVFGVPNPFDPNDNYLSRRDVQTPEFGLQAALQRYLATGNGMLPYLAVIRAKLPEYDLTDLGADKSCADQFTTCYGIIKQKLSCPCLLELLWSYWHEEGMLVQSMNAIMRRFQNVASPKPVDPLANLEIDPLRPLNNLLWGYVQDEQHRLSVVRRGHEYLAGYGLPMHGKAVTGIRPADTRSKFLEAFHHLLRLATAFFRQDDDTTVKADAFPVLNALKEVHLILSEGAHNQFGDLPSTARIEMMMQQWLLARPEFREFLPTRVMVAYPEPWMDRVDAMKKLQGWTDTSIVHFRNLAIFGEQLLLSIRYGNWSDEYEPQSAFNWARFFRPQVQGYVHAYRAATGVDLSAEAVAGQDKRLESTPPSVLMKRQLALQHRRA